jgi:hypothetical protein
MYKLTASANIYRTTDGGWIPPVLANTDYQQYLKWLAEGNTPEPYVAPSTPIPSIVSMRQARLALLQNGLLDDVNTAIAVGTEADKITWEYATEVLRTDALVTNMATDLGLTDTQLDALFTLASTL